MLTSNAAGPAATPRVNGSTVTLNQTVNPQQQQIGPETSSDSSGDSRPRRRGLLSKIQEDDLKFIDTSVDSDSNNFLIRNMTSDSTKVGDSILKSDDRGKHSSSLSINKTVEFVSDHLSEVDHNRNPHEGDSPDSALEEDYSKDQNQQTVDHNLINGSQYLAVLMEPSSSSGIDLAVDDEDKPQPTRLV